jgi:DNA polymerase-3 subunit epsilon
MLALIFDTETTELISNHSVKLDKQPEVIEYVSFLTDLATGERKREFETLIKPKNSITAKITEITHIDNEMVALAPPFADRAQAIKADIESAPIVIAHNASFDAEMINIEFERLNIAPPKWPRLICSVEATIHLKGYRLKLAQLYELLFGETFRDAHRARVDTTALERICVELFKRGEL